jgi:cell division protein ZapA
VNQEPTPVTVRILDKDYLIACQPEEKDGLLASARHVDERMREIRKSGRVIGTDRIAVMAALNLAYELLQGDDKRGPLDTTTVKRLAAIQGRIAAALGGPDGRENAPPPPTLDEAGERV